MKNVKPIHFKTLISRSVILSFIFTFIASSLIVAAIAFAYISISFEEEINIIEKESAREIQKHLATGWSETNMNRVKSRLVEAHPDYLFALLKVPQKSQTERTLLPPTMLTALEKVERSQTTHSEINLTRGEITGGLPIHYEQKCLSCHTSGVAVGDYAGTLVFQTSLAGYQVPLAATVSFLLLFVFIGFILLYRMLISIANKHVSLPLNNINHHLELIRQDEDFQWDRQTQRILEIDQIDETIKQNTIYLKSLYEKLDVLKVTERHTGFFNAEHFKDALQFEVYRAHRYERDFSLVSVKLHKITELKEGANRSLSEKLNLFANIVHRCVRQSDMVFRISEELFIILTPETGAEDIKTFVNALTERLAANHKASKEIELAFETSLGYATYKEDSLDGKELAKLAIERMRANKSSAS